MGGGFSFQAVDDCAASHASTSVKRQRVICGESLTGLGNPLIFGQFQMVVRFTPKCAASALSVA
jgi:hypothetical protein